MLNKAILTGRLTDRVELKTTSNGVSVAQFSLAVQRNFKGSDGNYATDFVNIVAWRNQAEFASKYFDKGSLMTVVGSIQTRKYEDKNGNKRTATEVVAEEILFAESKNTGNAKPSDNQNMQFEEVNDEDLPF